MSSTTALPLVPALRPSWTDSTARRVAIVLGGSLLLALAAQLRIPLWPVPVTAQTLVVLLLGFALGPRLAATTVVAYLAWGAIGLPVFTGWVGGMAAFGGATGGYLVGFVAAAALTGVLAERGWHQQRSTVVLGMVLGNLVIYAFGATWLASLTSPAVAWSAGIAPFLVGDALKIAVAVVLLPRAARLARR